jgi:predicted permease
MMPGGGRRYSESMVQMAALFLVILLAVFFALLIRSQFFDKDSSQKDAIMAVLKQRRGR